MFDAEVDGQKQENQHVRLTFIRVGQGCRAQCVRGGGEHRGRPADAHVRPGPLDHLGLQAASLEAFEEIRNRSWQRVADDFVTDFGPILSVFFRDPDGLEGEVCVANSDKEAQRRGREPTRHPGRPLRDPVTRRRGGSGPSGEP